MALAPPALDRRCLCSGWCADPHGPDALAPDVVHLDVPRPRAELPPAMSRRGGPAEPRPIATSLTAAIAVSSAVLDCGGIEGHSSRDAPGGPESSECYAVATNLVQITATGSSPRAAEALANAVANRLVVFVTSSDGVEWIECPLRARGPGFGVDQAGERIQQGDRSRTSRNRLSWSDVVSIASRTLSF